MSEKAALLDQSDPKSWSEYFLQHLSDFTDNKQEFTWEFKTVPEVKSPKKRTKKSEPAGSYKCEIILTPAIFEFTAVATGKNNAEAETNAAKDLITFFLRNGDISANFVPPSFGIETVVTNGNGKEHQDGETMEVDAPKKPETPPEPKSFIEKFFNHLKTKIEFITFDDEGRFIAKIQLKPETFSFSGSGKGASEDDAKSEASLDLIKKLLAKNKILPEFVPTAFGGCSDKHYGQPKLAAVHCLRGDEMDLGSGTMTPNAKHWVTGFCVMQGIKPVFVSFKEEEDGTFFSKFLPEPALTVFQTKITCSGKSTESEDAAEVAASQNVITKLIQTKTFKDEHVPTSLGGTSDLPWGSVAKASEQYTSAKNGGNETRAIKPELPCFDVASYECAFDPTNVTQTQEALKECNVKVLPEPKHTAEKDAPQYSELVKPYIPSDFAKPFPLTWQPPTPGYNAWTLEAIAEDAPLSGTKEKISEELSALAVPETRKVHNFEMKDAILATIQSNTVTIIQGEKANTLSGKLPTTIIDSAVAAGNGADVNVLVITPTLTTQISARHCAANHADQMTDDAEVLCKNKFAGGPADLSVGYATALDCQYPRPFGSVLYASAERFLAMIADCDGALKSVSHVICEDNYDRDLPCDLAMAALRSLAASNSKLRVVALSESLEDATALGKFFKKSTTVTLSSPEATPAKLHYLEDVIQVINFTMKPTWVTPGSKRAGPAKVPAPPPKIKKDSDSLDTSAVSENGTSADTEAMESVDEIKQDETMDTSEVDTSHVVEEDVPTEDAHDGEGEDDDTTKAESVGHSNSTVVQENLALKNFCNDAADKLEKADDKTYNENTIQVLRRMSEVHPQIAVILNLCENLANTEAKGHIVIFPGSPAAASELFTQFLQDRRFKAMDKYRIFRINIISHASVVRAMEDLADGVRKIIICERAPMEHFVELENIAYVIDSCRDILHRQPPATDYLSSLVWSSSRTLNRRAAMASTGCYRLVTKLRCDWLHERAPEPNVATLADVILRSKVFNGISTNDLRCDVSQEAIADAKKSLVQCGLMHGEKVTQLGCLVAKLPLIGYRSAVALICAAGFNVSAAYAITDILTAENYGIDYYYRDVAGTFKLNNEGRRHISFKYHSDHANALLAYSEWLPHFLKGDSAAEKQYCQNQRYFAPYFRTCHLRKMFLLKQMERLGFPAPSGSVTAEIKRGVSKFNVLRGLVALKAGPANFCFHKFRRALRSSTLQEVLIIRFSSISYTGVMEGHRFDKIDGSQVFPSPYVCYCGDMLPATPLYRHHLVSRLSMITPAQMAIFGTSQVEWCTVNEDKRLVLDRWLPFQMSREDAVTLASLRFAFQAWLQKLAKDPADTANHDTFVKAVVPFCATDACRYCLPVPAGVEILKTLPPVPRHIREQQQNEMFRGRGGMRYPMMRGGVRGGRSRGGPFQGSPQYRPPGMHMRGGGPRGGGGSPYRGFSPRGTGYGGRAPPRFVPPPSSGGYGRGQRMQQQFHNEPYYSGGYTEEFHQPAPYRPPPAPKPYRAPAPQQQQTYTPPVPAPQQHYNQPQQAAAPPQPKNTYQAQIPLQQPAAGVQQVYNQMYGGGATATPANFYSDEADPSMSAYTSFGVIGGDMGNKRGGRGRGRGGGKGGW